MKDIIIVPTSHIAEESIRAVERVIKKERPDCVAVELDLNRFVVMEHGEASNWNALRGLGVWTFAMFWIIKRLQSWLGNKVGIMPGSDMLKAVRVAEAEGVHVEFIDRDIGITLDRIRSISRREKAKLVVFLIKGLTIDSMLARAGRRRVVRLDLRRVPSSKLVKEILGVMKREFPEMYRSLVAERDLYMARRLAGLTHRFERIVAVVGAAHAPGLQELLCRKRGL
jgi:pheromone shutdown protein TraB